MIFLLANLRYVGQAGHLVHRLIVSLRLSFCICISWRSSHGTLRYTVNILIDSVNCLNSIEAWSYEVRCWLIHEHVLCIAGDSIEGKWSVQISIIRRIFAFLLLFLADVVFDWKHSPVHLVSILLLLLLVFQHAFFLVSHLFNQWVEVSAKWIFYRQFSDLFILAQVEDVLLVSGWWITIGISHGWHWVLLWYLRSWPTKCCPWAWWLNCFVGSSLLCVHYWLRRDFLFGLKVAQVDFKLSIVLFESTPLWVNAILLTAAVFSSNLSVCLDWNMSVSVWVINRVCVRLGSLNADLLIQELLWVLIVVWQPWVCVSFVGVFVPNLLPWRLWLVIRT